LFVSSFAIDFGTLTIHLNEINSYSSNKYLTCLTSNGNEIKLKSLCYKNSNLKKITCKGNISFSKSDEYIIKIKTNGSLKLLIGKNLFIETSKNLETKAYIHRGDYTLKLEQTPKGGVDFCISITKD
jgi:hypothetical protein